jgi:hypothetical protein
MNNDSNHEPVPLRFDSEAQLSETISNISTASVPTEIIDRLKSALSKTIVVRKMPQHSKWGPRFLITTAAMLIFVVSLMYWLTRNPTMPLISNDTALPSSTLPTVTTVLWTNMNTAALQIDLADVEKRFEKTSETIRLLNVRDQIDSLLETSRDWSSR